MGFDRSKGEGIQHRQYNSCPLHFFLSIPSGVAVLDRSSRVQYPPLYDEGVISCAEFCFAILSFPWVL
jgi:hypothetical protein